MNPRYPVVSYVKSWGRRMRSWKALVPALFASSVLTSQAAEIRIASFNIAWAGSQADFAEHIRVCTSRAVNWCDTRPKLAKGEQRAGPAESARAVECQAAFESAAGGAANSLLVAPCNAYKLNAAKWSKASPMIYAEKLKGLTDTVASLIQDQGVDVIAFQEVRAESVIKDILGNNAADFETCVARHSSFQTVGFAWRRSVSSVPGKCAAEDRLAVRETPGDAASLRRLRPGLALSLQIGDNPITLMNVHLKSGCANLADSPAFKGHELTDTDAACQILNRQVVPLESWVEDVAKSSPMFVLLGDFNRRLDEEAAAAVPNNMVRMDKTDPAKPNKMGPNGEVTSRFLWQELSDGFPALVQVPLTTSAGCRGFDGLDHILISETMMARQARPIGSQKFKVEQKSKQVIATSDHCPRVAVFTL